MNACERFVNKITSRPSDLPDFKATESKTILDNGDVRLVRRSDGTLAMGAKTKYGMMVLDECAGLYELKGWNIYRLEGSCYLIEEVIRR